MQSVIHHNKQDCQLHRPTLTPRAAPETRLDGARMEPYVDEMVRDGVCVKPSSLTVFQLQEGSAPPIQHR